MTSDTASSSAVLVLRADAVRKLGNPYSSIDDIIAATKDEYSFTYVCPVLVRLQ